MCNRQASWKAMIKVMSNDGVGFYLHNVIDKSNEGAELVNSEEWNQIISEFEDVFNMPSGLPPIRDYNHAIQLKPDVIVPNLRGLIDGFL
jgi:hypothetical protein